jgi:hypothetical protein
MGFSIQQVMHNMLRRKPDLQDLRTVEQLLRNVPPELQDDPGFIAETVVRANHIRELKSVVDDAVTGARRLAEMDGEQHAMQIASKVWRKVMDHLPVSAADRLRRQFQIACAWSLIVLAIGAISGWTYRENRYDAARQSHQAATETAFNRCIDAAEGHAGSVRNRDGKGERYDPAVFRSIARTCAAEYADRRAEGF